MSNLKSKQQEFLDALNDKLPQGVYAQYRPSQKMLNVLNVLVCAGGMILQAFGLIEDKDGSVHWFDNYTGSLY